MPSTKSIGRVGVDASNRYWIVPPENTFDIINKNTFRRFIAYLYWLAFTCLIFMYSLILFLYLKLKYGKNVVNNQTQKVINCIPRFIDIYPTSVYPLVTKAFELVFYKEYSLNEPALYQKSYFQVFCIKSLKESSRKAYHCMLSKTYNGIALCAYQTCWRLSPLTHQSAIMVSLL